MSPRPHRQRQISSVPSISGMRPTGNTHQRGRGQGVGVQLMLEEYEAIRLCDYLKMNHEQAAAMMEVSRPTFTRIFTNAREKIAMALVEGKEIVISGGNVFTRTGQCVCPKCGYEMPHTPGVPCNHSVCERCGARMIRQ